MSHLLCRFCSCRGLVVVVFTFCGRMSMYELVPYVLRKVLCVPMRCFAMRVYVVGCPCESMSECICACLSISVHVRLQESVRRVRVHCVEGDQVFG